jgi:tRNA threonylcarbamoyladenosine biosynthesis protein TsaE
MRRLGNLYHLDAYRLKKPAEFARIGLAAILREPRNIVLVEWADKIRRLIPKDAVWVGFKHGKREGERTIRVRGHETTTTY